MCILKALNILGLCLDIFGAMIIFKFTPHPIQRETQHGGNPNWIEKEAKEKRKVRCGMAFLIAGFILQLISAMLSN